MFLRGSLTVKRSKGGKVDDVAMFGSGSQTAEMALVVILWSALEWNNKLEVVDGVGGVCNRVRRGPLVSVASMWDSDMLAFIRKPIRFVNLVGGNFPLILIHVYKLVLKRHRLRINSDWREPIRTSPLGVSKRSSAP